MARALIDWSVDQFCKRCGVKMCSHSDWERFRPEGFKRHGAHGYCGTCDSAIRKGARRSLKDGASGRYPTVAELAAKGSPCVEPAPMPSRRRSLPW